MRVFGRSTLTVFLALSIVVFSCTEAPYEPTLGTFEFPLQVGNLWRYVYEVTDRYYEESDPDQVTHSDSWGGFAVSEVINQVKILGRAQPAFTVQTTWSDRNGEGSGFEHFDNEVDGLYLYGVGGSTWVGPPKRVVKHHIYRFNQIQAGAMSELVRLLHGKSRPQESAGTVLSTTENWPVVEWKYPLEVGKKWVYRDPDRGDPFLILKTVEGVDTISTPAGEFSCYRIRWNWDTDGDGVWDENIDGVDYIAPAGTIHRAFQVKGIEKHDLNNESVERFNSTTLYSLTSFYQAD